jgi:dTDP-4-dehydrorhamnose reductase
MRHLVIGGSGQVGESLLKTLHKRNEEIIGTFYKTSLWGNSNPEGFVDNIPPGKLFKLDITNSKDVSRLIDDIHPDIVYVPAAQTDIDYCELNTEESAIINVGGLSNVVDAVNKLKRKQPLIIFYSSNQVFDGTSQNVENDLPNPLNIFGQQKLDAEKYLKKYGNHYVIIRTNDLFGIDQRERNFFSKIIKTLREEKEYFAVEDEFISPTYVPDLTDATLKIINNLGHFLRSNTIVHISGKELVSQHKFTLDIAKIFNFNSALIKPVKSKELKSFAKRPEISGLNVNFVEDIIGRKLMTYIQGLTAIKKMFG